MTADWVRGHYGVTFKRGDRVVVDGRAGVVSDVDGLRALAEAATPGPWETHTPHDFEMGPDWDELLVRTVKRDWLTGPTQITPAGGEMGDDGLRADDAKFIAAASPDVVLGLLDRLAAAEAAVERVRDCVQGWSADGHYLWERMAASDIRDALDGPQDAATCEVALGSTSDAQGPQSASGAEGDHGDRREGEGLA